MVAAGKKNKEASIKKETICTNSDPWPQRRSKDLGFMSTALTACSLPLRQQKDKNNGEYITEYKRKNGNFTLTIKSDKEHGLPFGKDRLLFYWIFTEAIKTKSRDIYFKSFNEALGKLDLSNNGINHKWLKSAVTRFLHTSVSFCSDTASTISGASFTILEIVYINSNEQNPSRRSNYFRLSSSVFDQLIKHSASLDLEVIRRLSKNERYGVMDFYCWWTWRAARLEKEGIKFITVPISSLKDQFGVSETLPMKEFKRLLKDWIRDLELVIFDVYGQSTMLSLEKDKLGICALIPHKLPGPEKVEPPVLEQSPQKLKSKPDPGFEMQPLASNEFLNIISKMSHSTPSSNLRSFQGSFSDMREIFIQHFASKAEQWSEIQRQLGDSADLLEQEEAKWMAGIQRWFRSAWDKGLIY